MQLHSGFHRVQPPVVPEEIVIGVIVPLAALFVPVAGGLDLLPVRQRRAGALRRVAVFIQAAFFKQVADLFFQVLKIRIPVVAQQPFDQERQQYVGDGVIQFAVVAFFFAALVKGVKQQALVDFEDLVAVFVLDWFTVSRDKDHGNLAARLGRGEGRKCGDGHGEQQHRGQKDGQCFFHMEHSLILC